MINLKKLFRRRKKSHYEHLRKKWVNRHEEARKNLWSKHKDALEWIKNNSKQITAGSLGGLLLLTTPPALNLHQQKSEIFQEQLLKNIDKNVFLVSDLSGILPDKVQSLNIDDEQKISEIFDRYFGIKSYAELYGMRLNTSYGYIGQEQHLARFPGDNMGIHFQNPDDTQKYYSYGMAPGLGAWRYFSGSQNELTEKENLKEKYYIAVQTFMSEDFNLRFKEYRDFYRFRKMLVVNPQNGKAVIAVIGDSGPAAWTGKQLGGSPEVMQYLERVDGAQRGPVLYFFVDDPDDKIPLGPVQMV